MGSQESLFLWSLYVQIYAANLLLLQVLVVRDSSEDVRNVATTVLDHHALEARKAQIDEIAHAIQSDGIATQHLENQNLKPVQNEAERTIRHDTQNLMSDRKVKETSFPPKSKQTDEFDL